ncbi:MAG: glutamine synthetase type III, partial [Elusimicrobia bacterium]|nr:glutamine synthetase type III [Elusimicrobiota bacterium]
SKDVNKEVTALVKETWSKHHRVVFNGNNYSEEWLQEAAKRGLPNIRSSIEAYATMANKDAIRLFEKYKVLSKRELHSRFEVYVEQYVKHINIEARAALLMVKTQYLPAVIDYTGNLADVINQLKAAGADSTVQEKLLEDVSKLLVSAKAKLSALETNTQKASNISNVQKKAAAYRDTVFTAQVELRHDIDALEELLPNNLWPVPTYADMLFNF